MVKCRTYICLVLIILLSAPVDVCSAKVSRDDLKNVEKQVHAKEMELKKKQAESVALSLELAKLNNELINAAKQIQLDEEKTSNMENEVDLLEKKIAVLQENFSKEYKNLSYILLSMQNLALYPTETLIIQPLSPIEVIQSAILMRESVPYIQKNADKLKVDLQELTKQKKKLVIALDELEAQTQKLITQQKNIKNKADQKTLIRKKLEGESVILKNQVEKLASQASDLKDLVEKLEKDEDLKRRRYEEIKKAAKKREQEAFEKLEQEQRKRINEGKSTGFTDEYGNEYFVDNQEEMEDIRPQKINRYSTDFVSAKGRLIRPATGDIITSYGNELSKGVSSKGIVIKTRANAQIVAPYDGSVIFSGPFKGYGNLIIIDHGKGYVSLLAGMSSIDTQVGQMLLAGEPVGIMPDSDAAKLYMEIRKDQNPINPEPWLEK